MSSQSKLQKKAKQTEPRIRLVTRLIGVALTLAAGFLALSRAGGVLQSLA